jgi:hypothetical protein
MTPARLLIECTNRGVQLTALDGRLHFEAPAGALTPHLRTALEANRADVLTLLEAERDDFDERCAHQRVALAVANVATHGAAGYDPAEFKAFNDALAVAFKAQSMTAVHAACVAYQNTVRQRLAKGTVTNRRFATVDQGSEVAP